MTTLRAARGDITTLAVDIIVNAANSSLMGGGGVDGAIHRAGGPAILAECRAIVARQGGCATGEAVITGAGDLPAHHVVHTVGPVWTGRDPALHDAQLASCYRVSLDLAAAAGARTVAFPNVSTGAFGFPRDRAAAVAVAAVRAWVDRRSCSDDRRAGDTGARDEGAPPEGAPDEVVFVCFDVESLRLYEELLDGGA